MEGSSGLGVLVLVDYFLSIKGPQEVGNEPWEEELVPDLLCKMFWVLRILEVLCAGGRSHIGAADRTVEVLVLHTWGVDQSGALLRPLPTHPAYPTGQKYLMTSSLTMGQ